MAEKIEFTPARRDVRKELYHELLSAPEQHADAMLDLYAIAQLLRDKGVFEIVKDTLGSGEKVMEIVTETLEKDEVVRAIRNVIIFIKVLGSIEPETLERVMKALSFQLEAPRTKKPPGLWRLLGRLTEEDSRRALELIATALQTAGRQLPQTPPKPRPRTTRHKA